MERGRWTLNEQQPDNYTIGWNSALSACRRLASGFSFREYTVHPDIRHADLSLGAQLSCHSTAQVIAVEIEGLRL